MNVASSAGLLGSDEVWRIVPGLAFVSTFYKPVNVIRENAQPWIKEEIAVTSQRPTSLIVKSVLLLAFVVTHLLAAPMAFAQGTTSDKPPAGGPRRQLGTIIYAGLGGAVLGLSTLSFYGRPQDKLSNIAIGFAIGVITGTVFVTYNAATNPDDFYGTDNSIHNGRDARLGPAPAMTVVTNTNAEAFTPAFSTSYQLLSF